MTHAHHYLAVDLGAESGRTILGALDGDRLTLTETHRFPNGPVQINDGIHWDVLRLWSEIKSGIAATIKKGTQLDGVGLDTWGVDFALLDRNHSLLSNPGRTPVAGIVHALTILAVMLVAAPLAMNVPLAALAGILAFVAWNMGEWREFVRARQVNLTYRTILFGTFALTVVFDLTVAVEVGLVPACVFFIWRMGKLFAVTDHASTELPPRVQAYDLFGSLFFGAVDQIEALPARVKTDTRAVVLEMHRLISMDTSGLDALQQLHRTLQRREVALVLANVNEQPLSLIRRSGFEQVLGPDQIVPSVAAAFEDEPAGQWLPP